jgi:F420-0:gamma-glutamyl ligase
LPASSNSYGITLTITNNILIPSAGIDESNANGCYVLWPRDVQRTANQLRIHFKEKHRLHEVGVIITDSTTTPLRRGTTGISISHSGFSALNSYVDQPDIFDKPMRVTQANVGNGLASAAVVVMGEGSEQTPLAIINDTPFVAFQDRNPTNEELNALTISLDDDLYGPVLRAAPWLKV